MRDLNLLGILSEASISLLKLSHYLENIGQKEGCHGWAYSRFNPTAQVFNFFLKHAEEMSDVEECGCGLYK
ncbi:hypothetical protein H6P81_007800 [Aristolochia fimbriata]|uniref:Uncharacterized protein n=1 Tax=Aristolochia fimbriata TaxID=158543 RepID=A0AAV7F2I5_ARIFI|nr:hypothetical protein H6P81_007800 [Aristolochia fimbriata]